MKTKPIVTSQGILNLKHLAIATCVVGGLLAVANSTWADANYSGTGDWSTVANWSGATGPTGLPGSSDNVTLTGGPVVTMSAASWQDFVDNSLLTSGSSGEYRTAQLRVAPSGTATLNLDIGDGNIYRPTTVSTYLIGSASGSDGTVNIYSGDIRFDSSKLYIGEKSGSTGLLNISGNANTRLILGKESGGVSLWVGTGGTGTFQIDGGKFRTRAGAIVGSSGIFSVLGSSVTEVEIGSESTIDGNWTQNAGGILNIGIDSGGVTQINVADKGGSGTFATFDNGSLLDVGFLGSPVAGTWTVMEVQNGAITDNGLGFAAGVDSGWSFDIDNTGANGILNVTYVVPEPTTFALAGLGIAGLLIFRRKA